MVRFSCQSQDVTIYNKCKQEGKTRMENPSPIRQRMAELNISGPALADAIGVPYRSLDEFIRRRSGNYLLLKKIAQALNTTMDALAEQDGDSIKPLAAPDIYDTCRRLYEAYKIAVDKELSERYRRELLSMFSEIAWQFQSAQSDRFIQLCNEGEFDKFLDLYSDIHETTSDIKYFVMDNVIRNICVFDKTELINLSVFFTQHGFEEEAKRIMA